MSKEDSDKGDRIPVVRRAGARLPHWTREGSIYAVTFRLGDSLPHSVLAGWLQERRSIVERARLAGRPLSAHESAELAALHDERVQRYLDTGAGACWMRDRRIADLVEAGLRHFDGDRYALLAWCAMPNHVHVVVQPQPGHALEEILHSWKSFTATAANRLLGRCGPFWQREYYDHLIRDEEDFRNQVRIVLRNPEEAGLRDWKWVGCREAAAERGH